MNVTFFILAAQNGCFAFVIKIAEGWKENEEIANNEKGQRPMTEIEMWIMLGSFFRADNVATRWTFLEIHLSTRNCFRARNLSMKKHFVLRDFSIEWARNKRRNRTKINQIKLKISISSWYCARLVWCGLVHKYCNISNSEKCSLHEIAFSRATACPTFCCWRRWAALELKIYASRSDESPHSLEYQKIN